MTDLTVGLNLPEELVEAIAQRVAAILLERTTTTAEWVTADAVAAHLGLSRVRVYELVKADGLPHKRVGERSMRFQLDAVDAWVARTRNGS